MRVVVRIAVTLAILIGVFAPAGVAFADDPSISIDNITIAPGGSARSYQPINYHNLPPDTAIYVTFPHEILSPDPRTGFAVSA